MQSQIGDREGGVSNNEPLSLVGSYPGYQPTIHETHEKIGKINVYFQS